MLSLSYITGEHLAYMLAKVNAPEDAVMRAVVQDGEYGLKIDTVQPDDATFAHGERIVLVINEQVSKLLADMKLDVEVTGEEPELVLIKQLEE